MDAFSRRKSAGARSGQAADTITSHVGEPQAADEVGEQLDIGIIKVGVHHGTLSPLDELCLSQRAVEVARDLVGDGLTGDFHARRILQLFVAGIERKLLVYRYQAMSGIVDFLGKSEGGFEIIHFFDVARTSSGATANLFDVAAASTGERLPILKLPFVLFA